MLNFIYYLGILLIGIGLFMVYLGLYNKLIRKKQFLEKRLKGTEYNSGMDSMDLFLKNKKGKEEKEKTFNEKIELLIEQSGVELELNDYYTMTAVAILGSFSIGYLFFANYILGLALGLGGIFIPYFYLKRQYKKRLQQFNDQLVDTLRSISSSMRGGLSLEQALQSLAKNAPEPTRTEFKKVIRDIEIGRSVEQALKSLQHRIDDKDLDLTVAVIFIQRELGGDLTKILDKIAHTISERIKLKQQLDALTAQGKMSAILMGNVPVVLFFLINMLNPNYLNELLSIQFGPILLGIVFIFDIIGTLWALKLSSPDIKEI